jgi:hypothetical protein
MDEKCYEQKGQIWENCPIELRQSCEAAINIVIEDKPLKKLMKS